MDIRTGDSTARTDLTTVTCLTMTLLRFAFLMSVAMFATELPSVPDTPYLSDLLYSIGSKSILHLTFFVKLMYLSTLYIGAIALEPVLLSAWGQTLPD